MTLTDGSERVAPDEAELIAQLRALGDEEFVVLSERSQFYLQAMNTQAGFVVEYREGSSDDHYEATELVELELTCEVFGSYLRRSDEWRTLLTYRALDLA